VEVQAASCRGKVCAQVALKHRPLSQFISEVHFHHSHTTYEVAIQYTKNGRNQRTSYGIVHGNAGDVLYIRELGDSSPLGSESAETTKQIFLLTSRIFMPAWSRPWAWKSAILCSPLYFFLNLAVHSV